MACRIFKKKKGVGDTFALTTPFKSIFIFSFYFFTLLLGGIFMCWWMNLYLELAFLSPTSVSSQSLSRSLSEPRSSHQHPQFQRLHLKFEPQRSSYGSSWVFFICFVLSRHSRRIARMSENPEQSDDVNVLPPHEVEPPREEDGHCPLPFRWVTAVWLEERREMAGSDAFRGKCVATWDTTLRKCY